MPDLLRDTQSKLEPLLFNDDDGYEPLPPLAPFYYLPGHRLTLAPHPLVPSPPDCYGARAGVQPGNASFADVVRCVGT